MFTNYSLRLCLSLLSLVALAPAIATAGQAEEPGRVAFDFAGAPAANVEVDLKKGMLSALTEITVAAVDGATEGLQEAGGPDSVRQTQEIMGALREILGLTSEVVQEVRIRVYEGFEDPKVHSSMANHYQTKLREIEWDSVVRVREREESVSVCVQREGPAIRGVFVMVSEGNGMILANVVCELTPERVKQLTNRATKIGLKFGLGEAIEDVMRELPR